MPKVSVVTLPSEVAIQAPSRAPSSAKVTRRLSGQQIYRLLSAMAAPFIHPRYLLVNVLALLLGRVSIMGEMAPFGLAFFAALAHTTRERAAAAGLWAIIGVLSTGHYAESAVYGVSILLFYRLADKLSQLERKMYAVPLFMFATVTLGGMALIAWQQATIYSVLVVLLDAALCMTMSFIFIYGIPIILGEQHSGGIAGETAIYAIVILALAIAGIGDVAAWGYSLRSMAGGLLIMTLALAGGAGLGSSAGVAVGLVVGLSDGNASLAISLYALAGLLGGLFRSLGKFAVILGFLLGSAIVVLYFGHTAELMTVLTESAISAALLLAIPAGRLMVWHQEASQAVALEAIGEERINLAVDKLNHLSAMFGDLADTVGTLSAGAKEKIREEEVTAMLSMVGEKVCGPCSRRAECWDKDFYKTYQAILDTFALAEAGSLTGSSITKVLRDNCLARKELIETINGVAERNRANSFWQKKIGESRQMVTEQMRATGTIIANLATEIKREPQTNKEFSQSLQTKAAIIECPLEDVRVSGAGSATVIEACKHPCNGTRECLNSILPLAANLLHEKMTLHAECGSVARRKKCHITMKVDTRYSVTTGMASVAKQSQEVCGDTCVVAHIHSGKIAMMLSDGMGSGKQAAGESAMAVKFLERLLTAGFDVDVAVKTVNSMLMLRAPDETFATIDMAIIDTYSGETEFLKIGSAPSFVKRVREVATVKSASLPIGILNQIEIEPVKAQLVPGDIVVMVSDGIADVPYRGAEKDNWVANFLRCTSSVDPQDIADKLLRQARDLSGGNVRDDMTVLVAKIVEQAPSLH